MFKEEHKGACRYMLAKVTRPSKVPEVSRDVLLLGWTESFPPILIFPLSVFAQDGTFLWGLKWTTCPTHQRRTTFCSTAYSVHSSGGVWQLSQTEANSGSQRRWCLKNKSFHHVIIQIYATLSMCHQKTPNGWDTNTKTLTSILPC